MKVKAEKILNDLYRYLYKSAAELKGITPMDAPDYIEELERNDLKLIAHNDAAFEVLELLADLNEWTGFTKNQKEKCFTFETLNAISTGGDNFWDEENEEWNDEYYSHS